MGRRTRIWLISAVLFGLLAAACAGSTSQATAPVEEVTAEVPASEATTLPEAAPSETVAPPTSDTPTPETTAEEPSVADEAAPTSEPAPVSPLFAGDFVDLNGESIDFASFEGQDTVLWFWAPW